MPWLPTEQVEMYYLPARRVSDCDNNMSGTCDMSGHMMWNVRHVADANRTDKQRVRGFFMALLKQIGMQIQRISDHHSCDRQIL